MAAGEKKVSLMTYLASVPDTAKFYIVLADGSYGYTTKADILAGIVGGTVPTLQQAGEAGNTINDVPIILTGTASTDITNISNAGISMEDTNPATIGIYTFSKGGMVLTDDYIYQQTFYGQQLAQYVTPSGATIIITPENVGTNIAQYVYEARNGGGSTYKFAVIPITVTGSLTAENNTNYVVTANSTFTDPTGVNGKGYIVYVRTGIATIGGVGYGVGSLVYRFYDGSWTSKDFNIVLDTTPIDGSLNGITSNAVFDGLASKEDLSNKDTNVTLGTSDIAYPSQKAVKTYVDDAVSVATLGIVKDKGNYTPSGSNYPSTGGSGTSGAILKGDLWTIAGLGSGVTAVVGSKVVSDGDVVRSLVNTPGNTDSNWAISENNIGYVAENQSNKSTNVNTDQASNTKYASVKAVYDWATGLFQTISGLSAAVLATVLTGLSAASGTFTSSDTILVALGKCKYLIDNIASVYATIASPTFTGTVTTPALNLSGETANRCLIIDGTKKIVSASQAIYPSPTEFTYVKGVTSAIQSQIDGKQSIHAHTITAPTTGGTVNLVNNQHNIINPAGTISTLTVNLPSSPLNNNVVYIKYTQAVTTVSYGNGTVVSPITSPVMGQSIMLTYDSATTSWY